MKKTIRIRELEKFNKMFIHAENIGQVRLNNFLMTGSILLVGCAVSLTISEEIVGPAMSSILSVVGVAFCRAWYYLGSRQRKFHNIIQACRDTIIAQLEEHDKHSHYDLVCIGKFQSIDGDRLGIGVTSEEKIYSSRTFLTVVPRYFAYSYLGVLLVSLYSLEKQLNPDAQFQFIVAIVALTMLIIVFSCKTKNTFSFLRYSKPEEYTPNGTEIRELVNPILRREGIV